MESPGLDLDKRERRRAIVVALLCLSGAATGGLLLYRDYESAGAAGVGEPVAQVVRKESRVRRKVSSSFVWSLVRPGENLYLKDSVQTGNESAATLRFKDGSILEISENSLVVIDDIQKLSLSFLKGSAVVQRKGGGVARITVGDDGKTRVEELPVRLVTPERLAREFVLGNGKREIRFEWVPRKPGNYLLQVSTSSSFKNDVHSFAPRDPTARSVLVSLGKGRYFWRVVPKNGIHDGRRLETRPFVIASLGALVPVSPVSGASVRVFGESGAVAFRFSDPGNDSSLSVGRLDQIEVARDPGFRSVVAKQKISPEGGFSSVAQLPPGKLYWRLKTQAGDLAVTSPSEVFSLDRAQKPSLELVQPAAGAMVESENKVYFSWKSDNPELESLFEVERADGSKAYSRNVLGTGIDWKKAPPGNYRWRVGALDHGKAVAESAWREVKVAPGRPLALESPLKAQKILYWESPARFDFRWRAQDALEANSGNSYLLEISNDGFKSVRASAKTKVPRVASDDLKLPSGDLSWRVSVIDGQGQRIKQSEVREFSYGTKPRLGAPEALAPKLRERVNLLAIGPAIGKEKRVELVWSKVPEAREYEIAVYRAEKGRAGVAENREPSSEPSSLKGYQLVSKVKTSETSSFLEKLRPGRYFWTVRAVDPLERAGASMPYAAFTADYGDPLAAPEILTPEVE